MHGEAFRESSTRSQPSRSPPVVATAVSDNTNVAAQQNIAAQVTAQHTNWMRQRIEQLFVIVSTWAAGAYPDSNTIVYGLLQKSYVRYLDLINNADGTLKHRKQGLDYSIKQDLFGTFGR